MTLLSLLQVTLHRGQNNQRHSASFSVPLNRSGESGTRLSYNELFLFYKRRQVHAQAGSRTQRLTVSCSGYIHMLALNSHWEQWYFQVTACLVVLCLVCLLSRNTDCFPFLADVLGFKLCLSELCSGSG